MKDKETIYDIPIPSGNDPMFDSAKLAQNLDFENVDALFDFLYEFDGDIEIIENIKHKELISKLIEKGLLPLAPENTQILGDK